MMDLKSVMNRVDKEGIAIIQSSYDYKNLPKKGKYLIYSNRRKRETTIINKKVLKKKGIHL